MQLSLRTVNSSRSAYACFLFFPSYFQHYDDGITHAEAGDSEEEGFRCKITMKVCQSSHLLPSWTVTTLMPSGHIYADYEASVNTTAPARLALSAWADGRPVHFRPQSDQTWKGIRGHYCSKLVVCLLSLRTTALCSRQLQTTALCSRQLQITALCSRQQMTYSGMQAMLIPALELSPVQLTRVAWCKRSIPCPAQAQPGGCRFCKWLQHMLNTHSFVPLSVPLSVLNV